MEGATVLSRKERVYATHNDRRFTEELRELAGMNLSRETVRQILRGAGAAANHFPERWLEGF
jgi:hypothetical protein